MAHVERDIFIQASPEAVMDYAGNPANTPDWYEGVVETHADFDAPVVGGKIQQVYTAAGVRMEMTLTIAEYEPNQNLTFEMDGMVTGTYRWDYIPEGDGVRVKGTVDYEMRGGALGQIADKLVVERMNVSQMEKSLQNLKAKVEG